MRNLPNFLPFSLAVLLLVGCRQDMHNQPHLKPLAENDFYKDLRAARPVIEGTVARGQLHDDTYFYTGTVGNSSAPGDCMPFPVTADILAGGQRSFNIYCAVCHSRLGDGNGIVPAHGFPRQPPSYHTERLRKAPLGYFYGVITHGFGIMSDYSAQISPRDRWAIVAYIRALQLSQSATAHDIPPGQPVPSPKLQFRGDPGSGATLPEMVRQSAGIADQEPK